MTFSLIGDGAGEPWRLFPGTVMVSLGIPESVNNYTLTMSIPFFFGGGGGADLIRFYLN